MNSYCFKLVFNGNFYQYFSITAPTAMVAFALRQNSLSLFPEPPIGATLVTA